MTAFWEWIRAEAQADPMGFGVFAGIVLGSPLLVLLVVWAELTDPTRRNR